MLFDYKVFAYLYQLGFNLIYGTGIVYKDDNEDPDIGGERDKVDAAKIHSCNSKVLLKIYHKWKYLYYVYLNFR